MCACATVPNYWLNKNVQNLVTLLNKSTNENKKDVLIKSKLIKKGDWARVRVGRLDKIQWMR